MAWRESPDCAYVLSVIQPRSNPAVLLVSTRAHLIDAVMAAAAAVEVAPVVVADTSRLKAEWAQARTVLVGADLAADVAAAGLGAGPQVHLVGDDPSVLSQWSMPLGATVIELPAGAAWLTNILAGVDTAGAAPVVVVVGGSGGVGASTLATGLAYRAAQDGRRTVLVDADPLGGGIDLLLGAERVSGWRWDKFAHASGQLGDLRSVLPSVDGLDLLSVGRGEPLVLARDPVAAVIGSLRRSHELVVVDVGRGSSAGSLECRRAATVSVLVVGGRLRAVAAAQRMLTDWAGPPPCLVVRQHRLSSATPEVLADRLGLKLAAVLPEEPALAGAAERGEPPGRAGKRRGWGRACADLVRDLT